jgi:lipopolysaccharide transport protein LptA
MSPGRIASLLLCLALPSGAFADEKAAVSGMERLGVQLQSGTPMKITADELEAVRDESGAERIIFTQNVHVEQGELEVFCDWLEAMYPETAGGQADKITARGSVRILQMGREASCTEAIFDNVKETAQCTTEGGKSRLRRGEDTILADRIYFDLKTGKFRASGGVEVLVRSEEDGE